jgi:hypothetical protein
MKTNIKLAVLIGLGALAANQASASINLVVNGGFESGDAAITSDLSFSSGYVSVTGTANGLATAGDPPGTGEGQYAVGGNSHFYHSAFTSAAPQEGNNMMIVNGSTYPNKNVWSGTLSSSLVANQTYAFSVWVMNVYHDGSNPDANLEFSIGNHSLGTFTVSDVAGVWHEFTATYTPSVSGQLPAALDLAVNSFANDFAIDNISLTAVPEPTTMVAGALLLLPFGASTLRILRRRTA